MTKNIKFFLIPFLISLPIFWGLNVLEANLEDFFYWKMTNDKLSIIDYQSEAQISQSIIIDKSLKPIRNWEVEEINLEAKSAISVLVDFQDRQKILFKKNIDQKMPIASLSKLMTALIVLENYVLSEVIQISEDSIKQDEDIGNLKRGDKLKVNDLLHSVLMESSNDGAYALANDGEIKKDVFIDLMNLEVKNLGLKNTYFVNPTGLDPDEPNGPENLSTTEDLAKLSIYILKKQPLIFEISAKNSYEVLNSDSSLHHFIPQNTNKLFNEIPNKIIGCKTGWTPNTKGCLLLVIEASKQNGYLINVILGSENRFEEMKNLINWLNEAYIW